MSTINPVARADAQILREIAHSMGLRSAAAERANKQALFEIALRMDCGLYGGGQLPPAPPPQPCACVPGTCRGGQVVNGRLPNGWQCRALAPSVPARVG